MSASFFVPPLIALLIVAVMLFIKFGGSVRRRPAATAASPTVVTASATSVTTSAPKEKSWPWIAVLAVAGIASLAYFYEGSPGEVHSVRVVMNNPNGVWIRNLKPGRYRFWAEESSRLQAVDGGARMMKVWPDGRTNEQISPIPGGRPGYFERMGHWDRNPIHTAPSFALIIWVKSGARVFQGGGIPIEGEVEDSIVIDQNVPRREPIWFVNNEGESTIYYQRIG